MFTAPVQLAAGDLTGAIGTIPAAGIALILIVVLILGVIGKGKKKLASGPAQAWGIVAELAFLRSPAPFRDIGEAVQSIPTALASNEGIGSPGMAAVCGLFIVLSLFARLVPVTGALLGLLMGAAFAAADGSIWQLLVSLFSLPLSLVGA
ncbi:MAG TPA: hypothetical protein VFY14_03970 [Streptomyces sp.]|nr:hypothetical protein [Streptomyces sp.]